MRELTGRVVLVTGAGSGIGRATALAFAARGARLIVADVDADGLAGIAAALGPRCLLAHRVDVADRAAMAAFADAVHAVVPAVDVLINNAGVAVSGGLLDTTLDDWDWLLGVNLRGVVHGCHFFVPAMVARGAGGHVVNVSSVLGLYGAPGVLAYVTSKFAVRGLSEGLRAELAPHHIGVSAICPGMINTRIVVQARRGSGASAQAAAARAVDRFRKRGADPALVGAAIVDAVVRDRALVPVAPEAWVIWGLARAAPGLLARLGQRAMAKV
ncbi:MAG: SDR family NAD(P)-dependent oxidoreductase [Kofleriaceae bacterium]|nr:SDR family NAD(P)-dependent oxidoreductase [Kofleriaceae bacterium]